MGQVIRGTLPDWASGYGSGDGSGYGSGDGSGSGSGSGYGYGYGSGDGYGYGYGSGDGYGYGSGDGSGYGSGYGYGYGSGDGSGSGYGYGYGYGSGDGSGYGYGSGDGDGYWPAVLDRWKAPDGARLAFWWSNETGHPCNGGSAGVPASPGVVHETPGPLQLCQPGTLHATMEPGEWKGQRLWVVALHGEVVGDDVKLGCLKREILGEVT